MFFAVFSLFHHSDEVFTSYKCSSLPTTYKCVKHPGNIVEAGSLAVCMFLTIKYISKNSQTFRFKIDCQNKCKREI